MTVGRQLKLKLKHRQTFSGAKCYKRLTRCLTKWRNYNSVTQVAACTHVLIEIKVFSKSARSHETFAIQMWKEKFHAEIHADDRRIKVKLNVLIWAGRWCVCARSRFCIKLRNECTVHFNQLINPVKWQFPIECVGRHVPLTVCFNSCKMHYVIFFSRYACHHVRRSLLHGGLKQPSSRPDHTFHSIEMGILNENVILCRQLQSPHRIHWRWNGKWNVMKLSERW